MEWMKNGGGLFPSKKSYLVTSINPALNKIDDICLVVQVKTLIKYTKLYSLLFLQFQQIPFMITLFPSFSFTNGTNLLSGIKWETMVLVYNVIRYIMSRLLFWVDYFIYFKFTSFRDKFSKTRHIFVKMFQIVVSLKNDHLVE